MTDDRTAKNYERVVRARDDHNARCAFPAHTLLMHPFDIERLGWEEGETIAGLAVKADDRVQPERFRLLCDRNDQAPKTEATEAVAREELVSA